jgi:hypothetical protein
MASNGPPPKPDMRFAISPPPPIKRAVVMAVRERISVRMDAGSVVATGLLGIALASDGSSVEDGE